MYEKYIRIIVIFTSFTLTLTENFSLENKFLEYGRTMHLRKYQEYPMSNIGLKLPGIEGYDVG